MAFSNKYIRIAEGLGKTKALRDFLRSEFGGDEEGKDDFIFEQTRRIIIATFQHIVYTEYLPLVLGEKHMTDYDLNTKEDTFSKYDQSINPTIINEFATFSYR